MKEKIRPLYFELQGYLSQAPESGILSHESSWGQYHLAIDELCKLAGENFAKFKVNVFTGQFGTQFINVDEFRLKIGGLINHLYAKFFPDELIPFSGMPSTIINQNQQQGQSNQVQILLDVQSLIDAKLTKVKDGSNEQAFLTKVKNSLSSVSNVAQLINLILDTGKNIGLNLEGIINLLK